MDIQLQGCRIGRSIQKTVDCADDFLIDLKMRQHDNGIKQLRARGDTDIQCQGVVSEHFFPCPFVPVDFKECDGTEEHQDKTDIQRHLQMLSHISHHGIKNRQNQDNDKPFFAQPYILR